jgi:hypothetical protein
VSGLLAWLKAAPVEDPRLGRLERRHGTWRGTIALPGLGDVALRLGGGRGAPDSTNLVVARGIAAQYPAWRSLIEAALFEHYEVYRDAFAAGDEELQDLPMLAGPGAVWAHVRPVHVLVEPISGAGNEPVVEIAFGIDWDIEHTVGARLQGGRWMELCGSVWVGTLP